MRETRAPVRIRLPRSRYAYLRGTVFHPNHRECGVVIAAAGIAGRHVVSFRVRTRGGGDDFGNYWLSRKGWPATVSRGRLRGSSGIGGASTCGVSPLGSAAGSTWVVPAASWSPDGCGVALS